MSEKGLGFGGWGDGRGGGGGEEGEVWEERRGWRLGASHEPAMARRRRGERRLVSFCVRVASTHLVASTINLFLQIII